MKPSNLKPNKKGGTPFPQAYYTMHLVTLYDLGNNDFSAIRVMQSGDTEGVIQFTIDYKDFAGRPGKQVTETTDGSNVIFDETEPTLTSLTIESDNADPTIANVGDTVTLRFTANEELLWPTDSRRLTFGLTSKLIRLVLHNVRP